MSIDRSDLIRTVASLLSDTENQSQIEKCRRAACDAVSRLSNTEKFILSKIAAGWSSRDIAAELGVETTGISQRRAELFDKINVQSAADAARVAIYADLY